MNAHGYFNLRSGLSAGLIALACLLALTSQAHAQGGQGLQKEVTFDVYSPLARSDELLDRLFTPLLADRLRGEIASGQTVRDQSIDLTQERFSVYVPTGDVPANGYGLLVFVMPWAHPVIPRSWQLVLDRLGVICVMTMGAGNSANVVSQRIPMALTGYENVRRRYTLNPARVYIGGLSGGSRVALRMALAFPDVFHGAVLNAGSDRFGTDILPPPNANLFRQFEEHTRLMYVTGTADDINVSLDRYSRDTARDLCVTDIQELPRKGRGHEMMDSISLEKALTALDAPRTPNPDLEDCRARRTQELDRQLAKVEALIAAGDRSEAGKQLKVLDEHFGGLAAPRSVDLAHKL